MMNDINNNIAMLNSLNDRLLSIADSIIALRERGYMPNKNKYIVLKWSNLLIDSCNVISSLDAAKQNNLYNIINKVIKL